MEKVIDCPVCYNTDNCFEEVQETFSSYLCFACGFMSDSRYEVGSINLIENLKNSPQLVRDSQIEDKHRNITWFPSVNTSGDTQLVSMYVASGGSSVAFYNLGTGSGVVTNNGCDSTAEFYYNLNYKIA